MKGTQNSSDHEHGDVLEELFRHASARERPSPSDEEAIRDALHAQWRESTRHRKQRRKWIVLAAAASVILAVFAGSIALRAPAPPAPAMQVASVEKIQGTVMVYDLDDGPVAKAGVSAVLATGQGIVTGTDSRLAIRWRDGTSVRMDHNSEVRFTLSGEIDLVAGRLYVDTEQAGASAGRLIIQTPAGLVSHLGTQYMAAVEAGKTSLSVREGQAVLNFKGRQERAGKGEQLLISASGLVSLEVISSYGELWQWTETLAPSFSSDGRSLSDFLGWVGRESGRTIEFASPEAEQLAATTLLRGNVELEPMRALGTILQTTDLVSEVHAGAIVVALRSAD